MKGQSSSKVAEFREAFGRIDEAWTHKTRPAKRLLTSDSFERIVTLRLLDESLGQILSDSSLPSQPLVLFMDRAGGGDGTRAATSAIEIVGAHTEGASFVHMAFSTPPMGLGTLIRSSLVRVGAQNGVVVDVVAHDRAVNGLELTEYDVKYIVEGCDLVISKYR